MAYLLRTLLLLMSILLALTVGHVHGVLNFDYSHILLAIATFLATMFIQAFVMFYFIGVSRMVTNIWNIIAGQTDHNLKQLFMGDVPDDLGPYQKKLKRHVYQSTVCKRQTIPWSGLILALGTLGFLLGGAHDTGVVSKTVHSGVVYGFLAACAIGVVRQWIYLGRTHRTLREVKHMFSLPDGQM